MPGAYCFLREALMMAMFLPVFPHAQATDVTSFAVSQSSLACRQRMSKPFYVALATFFAERRRWHAT